MHNDNYILNLKLRAGEAVVVRSREEILRTLDGNGCLDGLPFMPEMFNYCGSHLRVYKRAHKTCDTVNYAGGRRMENVVHLEGIRCDGQSHGGCQAECLIFWKEAWLKRAPAGSNQTQMVTDTLQPESTGRQLCTENDVMAGTCRRGNGNGSEPLYVCQATELLKASSPLPWWDLRQFWEDYTSGNQKLTWMAYVFAHAGYTFLFRIPRLGRWFSRLYNRTQRLRGKPRHPRTQGNIPAGSPTPASNLDLQPGELVRVKDFEAIRDTIDTKYYNRGLRWDAEMVPYCGGVYRVKKRVQHIVDEKTGRMLSMKTPCIILEGAICQARYSECRRFCPRSIYAYWREIWLERVGGNGSAPTTTAKVEGSSK
jgi:hypothetical protein